MGAVPKALLINKEDDGLSAFHWDLHVRTSIPTDIVRCAREVLLLPDQTSFACKRDLFAGPMISRPALSSVTHFSSWPH